MSVYTIQDTTLTDIADAIRSKTGKVASMTPAEMVDEIEGISGSSALPTVEILPEQTVTVSSENTLLSGNTEQLVTGNVYLLTVNGVSKIITVEEIYGAPSAIFLYYVRFIAGSSNNIYLYVYQESLYGTYTVKIEKVLGLEYATLVSKTVTANGTYLASDDDADGYDSVTVNVAGGASNIVTGTFKGTTTGAAMDVDLAYTGNGYPIIVIIYPTSTSESTFQDLLQRYAVRDYTMEKVEKTTTPSYTGSSSNDYGAVTVKYKGSTSNARSYSNGGSTNITISPFVNENAEDTMPTLVKIRSANKMSVFIASTSYGFAANIDYTYQVIYSS